LAEIFPQYKRQYEGRARNGIIVPTDEDTGPIGRGLSSDQLVKLRVSRRFWIEAGNLHRNRGPGRPGNQLMMSRNMRVFFGFPAIDLPRDTLVGNVALEYGDFRGEDCSLRFSNNAMDVLALPVPGTEGPSKYDQETLLFERVSDRAAVHFVLRVLSNAEKRRSKVASARARGGPYRMTSGREWGTF
jgi:hypothetical protein